MLLQRAHRWVCMLMGSATARHLRIRLSVGTAPCHLYDGTCSPRKHSAVPDAAGAARCMSHTLCLCFIG